MKIGNLYDGRSATVEQGHLKGVWHDLGRECATRKIGLRRIEVAPEHFSTPAHEHGADEEIFFVLGGDGLLWQDAKTFAVARDDCMVHLPKRGAHTLRAGEQGLDVLVFGERRDASLTALPRAGVAWSFPRWVMLGDGDSPFAREAAIGAPDCPTQAAERPSNVVALTDVQAVMGARVRAVGRQAGSISTGLNHVTLNAGEQGAPPHCHSCEEELFVVLEGDGMLELWARGAAEPECHPLKTGDVVSRLPGTGVAHSLRAGEQGLAYLAYGTRESSDMCFYPRTGQVALRGLGIALQSPEIEYLSGA